MPIIQSKKNGKAGSRDIANATYQLSDFVIGGEVINGIGITEIYWTGNWIVKRGANTILVLSDGQDNWILEGDLVLNEFPAANVVIETGATAGTLILIYNKYNEGE